jgi:hypothetical protein
MPYLSSRLTFTINNRAQSAQSKLVALQKSIQWVGHTAGHQVTHATDITKIKLKLLPKTGHFYLIQKICVPKGKKEVNKTWIGSNYAKLWDLILVYLLG